MEREDGFTLPEVLIAAAITGLLVASVTGVMRSALDRSQDQVRMLRMLVEADALLARLGLDIPPRLGKSRVAFSDGAVGVVSIEPYVDQAVAPEGDAARIELRHATIRITAPDDAHGLTVETLVVAGVVETP